MSTVAILCVYGEEYKVGLRRIRKLPCEELYAVRWRNAQSGRLSHSHKMVGFKRSARQRKMKDKLPKVTWYKQKLEKVMQIACCLGEAPHILTIDSVTMIGTDSEPLPYAFCPEHNAYFGISADVSMEGMVLKLSEEPVEVEDPDESKNNTA